MVLSIFFSKFKSEFLPLVLERGILSRLYLLPTASGVDIWRNFGCLRRMNGPVWFCSALVNSDTLTVYYGIKYSQFIKPISELRASDCSITVVNYQKNFL